MGLLKLQQAFDMIIAEKSSKRYRFERGCKVIVSAAHDFRKMLLENTERGRKNQKSLKTKDF